MESISILQSARRLVHEVDGLVRQKAVGDVAVAQVRRGHQGRVLNTHPVVHLVLLLDAPQDGDGVLHGGLPTIKTGWKRRSRAASFSMCLRYSSRVVAPMQRSSPRARAGLSMLEASIAPSAAPAPTMRVQLVDEEDDRPSEPPHLLEHGLESVLELAAVLGAGDERSAMSRARTPLVA